MKTSLFILSLSLILTTNQTDASCLPSRVKSHPKPAPEYTTILINQLLAQPCIKDKHSLHFIKGHIKSQDKKIKSQALTIKNQNKTIKELELNVQKQQQWIEYQRQCAIVNKESLGYSAIKFSAQYIATTIAIGLLVSTLQPSQKLQPYPQYI